MKSTIVESGTYAHLRATPLLDAGAGPADPGRHARRPTLAVRPADGLIRKLIGPRRPAITPGGNSVSHKPVSTRPIKLEASP